MNANSDPAEKITNLDEILGLTPAVASEVADPTYAKWLRWIDPIKDDLRDLCLRRFIWREYQAMLENNSSIEGSIFFYVQAHSFRDGLTLGIRRQCWRAKDDRSLAKLLHDMAGHTELLTRNRYVSLFPWGSQHLGHAQFDDWAGVGADVFPAAVIEADAAALEAKVTRIAQHVNKTRAHPEWSPTDARVHITMTDVDDALDEAERVFLKYFTLLTGQGLTQLTPVIQYDWMAPFSRPWLVS